MKASTKYNLYGYGFSVLGGVILAIATGSLTAFLLSVVGAFCVLCGASGFDLAKTARRQEEFDDWNIN